MLAMAIMLMKCLNYKIRFLKNAMGAMMSYKAAASGFANARS
jgi:hypothetical protein